MTTAEKTPKLARKMPLDRELVLHDAVRDQAEAAYRRALAKTVAVAEAAALVSLRDADDAQEKARRRRREEEAVALLLLLAGEAAFVSMFSQLAAVQRASHGTVPGAPSGPVGGAKLPAGGQSVPQIAPSAVSPSQMQTLAVGFAEGRAPLLEAFPKWVNRKLDAEVVESQAAGRTNKQIAARLGRLARSMEEGRGGVVSQTEAQACYGSAQIRILQSAGFKTALWDQLDRPTKRETHAANMALGPMPLGHLYSNGQRYPGDPNGGAGECLNCLCYLVGVERT